MVTKILIVGVGGFFGATLRYLIGGWISQLTSESNFPYGTLAVNILGCLAIGLISGLAETRGLLTPEMHLLILTGVLGALTTFSTFSYETASLVRMGESLPAMLNLSAQIILGLGAIWAGQRVSQIL
ncbi:MAG: fluoride efflux transporter CrcB [Chloroflexi bacterium]|nr:fluoride efflux transporter CrcB [Chloroflexota bacterium]